METTKVQYHENPYKNLKLFNRTEVIFIMSLVMWGVYIGFCLGAYYQP